MVNSNSMYLFIWYPVNWSNLCAQRDKDVTGNSNFYRDRCIYASADQLMRYISASMDNILTCDKDHKAKNISWISIPMHLPDYKMISERRYNDSMLGINSVALQLGARLLSSIIQNPSTSCVMSTIVWFKLIITHNSKQCIMSSCSLNIVLVCNGLNTRPGCLQDPTRLGDQPLQMRLHNPVDQIPQKVTMSNPTHHDTRENLCPECISDWIRCEFHHGFLWFVYKTGEVLVQQWL